jgi:hypothetical protein
MLDGKPVQHISSILDSRKLMGDPYRLAANRDKSFIGSYVLGLGFTMQPEKARELIAKDSRNADILFPSTANATKTRDSQTLLVALWRKLQNCIVLLLHQSGY